MTTVTLNADARFLRRVLLTLVGLTVLSGLMAGFATVHAMNAPVTAEQTQQ